MIEKSRIQMRKRAESTSKKVRKKVSEKVRNPQYSKKLKTSQKQQNPLNIENPKKTKKINDSRNAIIPRNPQNLNLAMPQNSTIKVLESTFLQSISHISQAPSVLHTEIAILGRSNVGKSSLINSLLNNKNLAKSSSTPGKTRLINFFLSSWTLESKPYTLRFIDFPGFGYARVSKSEKQAWDRNLSEFVKKRESIKLFIHLVDSRHIDLKIDSEIRVFLGEILKGDSAILEVLTKSDKLTRSEILALEREGKILVSNKNKTSIEILRQIILESLYKV